MDLQKQTLIISDNYDSNVQTKEFFEAYVRDYYTEVARRLHARGKFLAVHVDGESRGVLGWLATRRASPRLIMAAGDQVPPGRAAAPHRDAAGTGRKIWRILTGGKEWPAGLRASENP